MADRKKPGWLFWTTVVLVGVPVLYVLSFVPAVWLIRSDKAPLQPAATIYKPVVFGVLYGPDWLMDVVFLCDYRAGATIHKMRLIVDPELRKRTTLIIL